METDKRVASGGRDDLDAPWKGPQPQAILVPARIKSGAKPSVGSEEGARVTCRLGGVRMGYATAGGIEGGGSGALKGDDAMRESRSEG